MSTVPTGKKRSRGARFRDALATRLRFTTASEESVNALVQEMQRFRLAIPKEQLHKGLRGVATAFRRRLQRDYLHSFRAEELKGARKRPKTAGTLRRVLGVLLALNSVLETEDSTWARVLRPLLPLCLAVLGTLKCSYDEFPLQAPRDPLVTRFPRRVETILNGWKALASRDWQPHTVIATESAWQQVLVAGERVPGAYILLCEKSFSDSWTRRAVLGAKREIKLVDLLPKVVKLRATGHEEAPKEGFDLKECVFLVHNGSSFFTTSASQRAILSAASPEGDDGGVDESETEREFAPTTVRSSEYSPGLPERCSEEQKEEGVEEEKEQEKGQVEDGTDDDDDEWEEARDADVEQGQEEDRVSVESAGPSRQHSPQDDEPVRRSSGAVDYQIEPSFNREHKVNEVNEVPLAKDDSSQAAHSCVSQKESPEHADSAAATQTEPPVPKEERSPGSQDESEDLVDPCPVKQSGPNTVEVDGEPRDAMDDEEGDPIEGCSREVKNSAKFPGQEPKEQQKEVTREDVATLLNGDTIVKVTPRNGKIHYYNRRTRETMWELPIERRVSDSKTADLQEVDDRNRESSPSRPEGVTDVDAMLQAIEAELQGRKGRTESAPLGVEKSLRTVNPALRHGGEQTEPRRGVTAHPEKWRMGSAVHRVQGSRPSHDYGSRSNNSNSNSNSRRPRLSHSRVSRPMDGSMPRRSNKRGAWTPTGMTFGSYKRHRSGHK